MLDVYTWLLKKQEQQSVAAIFSDAWFTTYGGSCMSNRVDIDARNFERQHSVPEYVLSFYRRENRCTAH